MARCGNSATVPPVLLTKLFTARRHIDLLRVAAAAC